MQRAWFEVACNSRFASVASQLERSSHSRDQRSSVLLVERWYDFLKMALTVNSQELFFSEHLDCTVGVAVGFSQITEVTLCSMGKPYHSDSFGRKRHGDFPYPL